MMVVDVLGWFVENGRNVGNMEVNAKILKKVNILQKVLQKKIPKRCTLKNNINGKLVKVY